VVTAKPKDVDDAGEIEDAFRTLLDQGRFRSVTSLLTAIPAKIVSERDGSAKNFRRDDARREGGRIDPHARTTTTRRVEIEIDVELEDLELGLDRDGRRGRASRSKDRAARVAFDQLRPQGSFGGVVPVE